MPKTKTTIEIPLHLARLLAAEKEDLKEGVSYEDTQAVARALLRTLMEVNK